MSEPIRVLLTGAAGQIAYSLILPIANGDVFGKDRPVIMHLLDIGPMMGVLNGVTMEMQDCSLPLLRDVIATDQEAVAFKDIDVALLVGAMPRREGMERKDLLKANVKIFRSQGKALDQYAKKSVKVLVVGNPANTNALIASHYAPTIPKENFSCLTRLDHNRAVAQIASRVGVPCNNVKRVIIWGNHSNTQFADATHALVKALDGSEKTAYQAVNDDSWLKNDFLETVQKRGGAVIAARKLSSAMSAAKAICDHVRDWFHGTCPNNWVSMGVISKGEYGVAPGLMYSYPVQIDAHGKVSIVTGLSVSDWAKSKMAITEQELQEEKEIAMAECAE